MQSNGIIGVSMTSILGRLTTAANSASPRPPSKFAQEVSTLRARAYFGGVVLLGLILFLTQAPRVEGALTLLALLIVLNVLAEQYPIPIYGNTYITVGFALTTAIMILFGVPGVVILAPIEAIAGRIGRRKLDYKAATNSGIFAIAYASGAVVYGLVADVSPDSFTWQMIPATGLAVAVMSFINILLVVIDLVVSKNESLTAAWSKHMWVAPHFVALGFLGLALAGANIALGLVGILAFVTPPLMMRFSMKQYVDKTTENVTKLTEQNKELLAANIQIKQVSEELSESYDGTLEALVSALDARDQETKGHSIRVSRYMMDIARELGVNPGTKDWIDMQRGSLLHDVGKIGVSDTILLKPGKLTDDEWLLMRKHPEIGYNMLQQVKFLQGPAEIVLAHHERWDGKGYPKGLREEEIPLGARIFNVVDTFDSMTSDRPYRKALSAAEALNEILKYGGTQFDPLVVEAFLDIYETWVKEREELHNMDVRELTYRTAA